MPWLLDILLSLIFILIVIIGVERGFVRSIWGSVTIGVSFIISYIFGPRLGDYLCSRFVLDYVTDYAFGKISLLSFSGDGKYNISNLFENLPTEFTKLISNCGADIEMLKNKFVNATTVSHDDLYDFANDIALPISNTISHAIAIVALFLASVLCLWLIGCIIKVIVRFPVIRTLDRLIGFIISVPSALIVIWILSILLGIFVEKGFMEGGSADALKALTSNSYIFNFFCDLSPIDFINVK